MNISSIPAIDAAIGLFFFYFLLSLVCSAVNELIASGLNWRAKNLEQALRKFLVAAPDTTSTTASGPSKLLGPVGKWMARTKVWKDAAGNVDDQIKNLMAEPRLARLRSPRGRKPSYIPPRTFALALLDTFAPPADGVPNHDVLKRAQASLDKPNVPAPIKTIFEEAIAEASTDRARLRRSIETAFNEVMDRASGWYKRKIQIALLVIAVGVAGIANADTFAVGDRLLRDDALRAAVVAKATAQANAAKGGGDSVDDVADKVDDVKDLGLPLGWSKENQPSDALRWLWKVLGIAVTAAALSLGAPFWFDLIGKVAQLRGVGGRIGTAKDTSPVAVDRDDRSGVSVIT